MKRPKDLSALGNRVFDLLVKKSGKESLKEIAPHVGVPHSTLLRNLKNNTDPKLSILEKIAKYLDKTLVEIVYGAENGSRSIQQAAEPATQYNQAEISMHRQLIMSKLETLIAFFDDTYEGLPSELDKCLSSIKKHLRNNCDFFSSWENEQAAVLMERRKKRIGKNYHGRLLQSNEVNSK